MYPITSTVKALFDAEQQQILRITGRDKNGAYISITDANVIIDGFNIDRYSCNGEKLEVGTAIAAEMTLKLDNRDGQYDSVVFEGAELFVEIGIADWTLSNPTTYWIPCGYFTSYDQPRSQSIITINALDRMARFDVIPPTLTPWTDNNGNVMKTNTGEIIYFMADLVFPCTIANLVQQVALRCNVPFAQSLTSLPNYNYTISALPVLQQQVTFRNIIQWCAGIMGCNAWIDFNGSLMFSWYGATTNYTTTTANRFSSDLYEDNVTITGVQYTNTQGVNVISGTADYAIDMTGNYLAANGIAQILPAVKNKVSGFSYRPFTATVINAPYLWPMDKITFNKDGVNYTCAVTNVNFGINGATVLAGKGQTSQTNSGAQPAAMTPEQAFLIEQAAEVTRQLDNSLNQEEIFNRLTDNGETQGLLLYNGKVYLNASYINTGTLVADFIKGGTLTLGGANNVNGVLQILDASGKQIGTWNKDGINVNAGSITGGTINGAALTLGGSNNTSGTLRVNDASGNPIGTWSNSGLTLNKGSIIGPSITLGGSNNTSGTLTVKDASGTTIGTWNKDGINVNAGTINGAAITIGGNNSSDGTLSILSSSNSLLGVMDENGLLLYGVTYNIELSERSLDFYLKSAPTKKASVSAYVSNGTVGLNLYSPTVIRLSTASSNVGTVWQVENELYSYQGNLKMTFGDLTMVYGSLYLSNGNVQLTSGNFTVVNGTKNRCVQTSQYSNRLLYCYETPSPLFGDVGDGVIGEDGLCYVTIDPVFAQTITTDNYQVFLQRYGAGDCWVKERNTGWFVVEGESGLAFGWELKAKQKGFEQRRLDRFEEEPFTLPTQTYGEDAAQHINDIQKERISV